MSTVKYRTTIQFDNRISLCMYMLHYSIEGYSRWQSRKHTKRSTDGKVTLSCPPQPILLSLPVLPVSMICTCVYVYLYRHSMDHRSVHYSISLWYTLWFLARVYTVSVHYIDLGMVVINGFGNSSIQYRPLANDELNMRTSRPKRSRLPLEWRTYCCCFESPTAYWYN